MNALVFDRYGQPADVLKIAKRPLPEPDADQVRMKVRAAAVNDYDWSMVRGKPRFYRLMFGFRKPHRHRQIPGMEVAGVIDAIGRNVVGFEIGDAVYGDTSEYEFGAFAEFMVVNPKALVKKPETLSFAEAASLSHAFNLAWQGLFDVGSLQSYESVLINGGGGGVGMFALQLAKRLNAAVTGTDTGDKLQRMQTAGFDRVIDYKKMDFTREREQYDLILDCKTSRSPFRHARALKASGRYVSIGGHLWRLAQHLAWSPLFKKKQMRIVALKANKDLDQAHALLKAGELTCTVDGPFSLENGGKAVQYFGDGNHTGKVIIQIGEQE